jgi:phospholipid/cholesterol/gamma-HCH transport system substrate-binding protein
MKMDSRSRQLSIEVIVGGFMVLVFMGLFFFTIILSREAWFSKKYSLDVVFKTVMGLRVDDNVVVRGMPVGKVKKLDLQSDGVHVTAVLDLPVHPRRDYKITVVATSILGGRHLQIYEGTEGEPEATEGALFRGEEPHDLMSDAADVANALRKAMIEGGAIENFKATMAELRAVADRINSGKGTLGRLLSEDDTLYKDLSSTVASLKTVTERIEKGQGTLGKLLSEDDAMYKDFAASAASVKTITARLEKGEGTLGRLMMSDDRLYQDVAATAASLKTISEKIEKGEGAIGRLVQDESLYDDLKATIQELRGAIDDVRENTPVVTFGSIFLGAF